MKKGKPETREPEELEFYPFLSSQRQKEVDQFVSKLDQRLQQFAQKRYLERKTIPQIAEEMGYCERSLFKFRKKVLMYWYYQNQRVS